MQIPCGVSCVAEPTWVPVGFISRRVASVASARKITRARRSCLGKALPGVGLTPLDVVSHASKVELAVACLNVIKVLSPYKCKRGLLC